MGEYRVIPLNPDWNAAQVQAALQAAGDDGLVLKEIDSSNPFTGPKAIFQENWETPPTVPVPDISGMVASVANTELVNAGLTLGNQTSTPNGTYGETLCISSDPIAGTGVAPGSAVDILVSEGDAFDDAFSILFYGLPSNASLKPRWTQDIDVAVSSYDMVGNMFRHYCDGPSGAIGFSNNGEIISGQFDVRIEHRLNNSGYGPFSNTWYIELRATIVSGPNVGWYYAIRKSYHDGNPQWDWVYGNPGETVESVLTGSSYGGLRLTRDANWIRGFVMTNDNWNQGVYNNFPYDTGNVLISVNSVNIDGSSSVRVDWENFTKYDIPIWD